MTNSFTDVQKDYFHYGLQVPLYTHFTSPIRRLADLVVHYQVKSVLNWTSTPSHKFVSQSVEVSNRKRTAARKLGRELMQMHVWNALMSVGSVLTPVIVVGCNEHGLRFYSNRFEINGYLYFKSDRSIISWWRTGWDRFKLNVQGCSRCSKKIVLEVSPMTELFCFLTPGEPIKIKSSLAHTIVCPCCASDKPLGRTTTTSRDNSDGNCS